MTIKKGTSCHVLWSWLRTLFLYANKITNHILFLSHNENSLPRSKPQIVWFWNPIASMYASSWLTAFLFLYRIKRLTFTQNLSSRIPLKASNFASNYSSLIGMKWSWSNVEKNKQTCKTQSKTKRKLWARFEQKLKNRIKTSSSQLWFKSKYLTWKNR